MPYLAVILLGFLALVNLFVGACLLWLSCKICRVRRTSAGADAPAPAGIHFRRALAVVFGLALCGMTALVVLWLLMLRQPGADLDLSFSALSLLLHIGLLLVFMRLFVCPTMGRTLLVALLFEVLTAAYATGFVFAVNRTLTNAYIVPTGNMAETLRGYHKDVRCPSCSFAFAINCSGEVDPIEKGRSSTVYACVCPNCRQRIHFPSAPSIYVQNFPESVKIAEPSISGGDRFLVGRGLLGPDRIAPWRFDLIAHEYPYSKQSMLYLKRLIGLPSETIAIRGGELYVLSPDKGLSYDDAETKQNFEDPREGIERAHENDAEALERFQKGQFEILRKSPEQIPIMRRIVYDSDHRAKDQPARWVGADGWNAIDDHRFQIAAAAERASWLRYRHFLPENGEKPALIDDLMGYNTYQSVLHRDPPLGRNWVGDLILECEATIDNLQGGLTLELSRGVDRFRAHWELGTGVCTLLRVHEDGEQKLDSKPTALSKKGTYRLRFANVDQRLCVWVDDALPFGDGVAYAPAERAGPDEKNDFEPASIAAQGASVQVGLLRLFRDVYYTTGQFSPSDPDVPGIVWADASTWDGLRQPPVRTFYVRPDHYFFLGDNSAESSDSRHYGSVPHRLLLGKAFFVYYPVKRIRPLP